LPGQSGIHLSLASSTRVPFTEREELAIEISSGILRFLIKNLPLAASHIVV